MWVHGSLPGGDYSCHYIFFIHGPRRLGGYLPRMVPLTVISHGKQYHAVISAQAMRLVIGF